MTDIRKWLEAIGLGQYADAFEANEIEMDLLAQVDDQMLKDIGVSIGGHRLRIRNAIAKLEPAPVAEVNLSATIHKHETTAASAERRQLTVMFCDLVGSTALSTKLDPEDLRAVIGGYHQCVAETVARFDGFVAKYMGDGVLVYFGYPQAHEDDAERAVRAGLDIVAVVERHRAPEPLKVRIGIATGLVVVGDLLGDRTSQERAVVGDSPNLAARLQALAQPGSIVVAASTRRLLGDLFRLRDLGSHHVKGFGDPVNAWTVEGLRRLLQIERISHDCVLAEDTAQFAPGAQDRGSHGLRSRRTSGRGPVDRALESRRIRLGGSRYRSGNRRSDLPR
jgi:class 3 adenylate cyclase